MPPEGLLTLRTLLQANRQLEKADGKLSFSRLENYDDVFSILTKTQVSLAAPEILLIL
jgi:hypothetical protein